jgi:CBS domain-containing protein
MSDTVAGALLTIAAVAVIGALMYLRYRTSKKLELTTADASIVVALFAVWMLGSGKIAELTVGDVGIKMRTALKEASNKAVARQTLPIHGIEAEPKAGPSQIDEYIARGIEGLTFRLGDYYDGGIMHEYLSRLNNVPTFRYIIILNDDPGKSLFGMIDSRKLAALLSEHKALASENDLAALITNKQTDKLAALPGFITADAALTDSAPRQKALEAMQDHDVDWFPIVDSGHKLKGVVERSALAASLLVDVVNRLDLTE